MSGAVNLNAGGARGASNEPRKRKSAEEDQDKRQLIKTSSWIRNVEVLKLHGLEKSQEKVLLEIYATLHKTSYASLLLQKNQLEELAKQVKDVPPLSFLILIQKEPELKMYLSGIKEAALLFPRILVSCSPWERTVNDFEKTFKEHKKGDILGLKELLKKVDHERSKWIQSCIQEEKFRDLLEYFVMN